MRSFRQTRSRRAGRLLGSLVAAILVVGATAAPSFAADGVRDRGADRDHDRDRVTLGQVREANEKYRDVKVAQRAGYAKFYICTAQPGQGVMGQHFVNGTLAADPAIDPLHPEALVYQPFADGSYRLVAIEYVTFQADWDKLHSSPPKLFGHTFGLQTAPNRFGLPAFYELHVWLYKFNPSGLFFEWNPRVTCPPGQPVG